MRKTYYFDTGVTIRGPYGCQVWKGGTVQIPFDCENVPEKAIFKFACDNPELAESKHPNYIVAEILDQDKKGGLCSKCAYFQIIN